MILSSATARQQRTELATTIRYAPETEFSKYILIIPAAIDGTPEPDDELGTIESAAIDRIIIPGATDCTIVPAAIDSTIQSAELSRTSQPATMDRTIEPADGTSEPAELSTIESAAMDCLIESAAIHS